MNFDPARIRLFVQEELCSGAKIPLSAQHVHYLRNVMRLPVGGAVTLFNGRDGEWSARVDDLEKKSGTVGVHGEIRPQTESSDIWLLFAPVKRVRIDFIAQKATELGVSRIQPVVTERTNVSRVNTDRLRANAIEAAEQCWCLQVPVVGEPEKLNSLLGEWPADRRLILCDEQGRQPLPQALADVACEDAEKWAVLIGPEGGFTDDERQTIMAVPQTIPVSLGSRILRADTAVVSVLTLLQALRGDWYA